MIARRKLTEVTKKYSEPSQIDTQTPSLIRENWLENIAVGFRDNTYVLDRFLPEMPVVKDTAKYRVYSPKGYFKAAPKRGETALPEQSALQYSEDTYTAFEYAMEGWVSDDAVRNAAPDIKPLADEAEYLSGKIQLTQEILIANELHTVIKAAGTAYYTQLTAAQVWNAGATRNVLSNISTAIRQVVVHIGHRPNVMAMNTDTYEVVLFDTTVQDVMKRANTGLVTASMPIASLRGLEIVMADAVVNTGTIDTPTYTNILYDVDTVNPMRQTVVIAYVAPSDKLTLGHNFVPKAFKVYRGRGLEGDRRQANLIAVWKKLAPKITNVGAGYLIGNVMAAA